MLFIYAAGFSTAYVSLETGTGALILFSSVQISIIVRNLIMKEPLNKQEWLGMSFALIGFVLLVLQPFNTIIKRFCSYDNFPYSLGTLHHTGSVFVMTR